MRMAALTSARCHDPRADSGAAFRCARQAQIGSGNGRYLNLQIDTVKQGTGYARLIFGRATRPAFTRLSRSAAAATRVHRSNQLNARGISDAMIGSRDHCFTSLQRLAQGIQHLRREFRQLVEKQYTQMRQGHLSGFRLRASANQRRHACGMMWRTKRTFDLQLAAHELASERVNHADL